MAERTRSIMRPSMIAGWGAIAFLLVVTLGSVFAVWGAADLQSGFTASDFGVVRFTILQAVLSALLSTLLAIPVARALSRRRFWGRQIFITLLSAPFILPVIVAVFGITAIWGRSGLFSDVLTGLGQEPLNIYGLTGILLAHVFFNLPLAARLFLQGWLSIPSEHFRLSAQLDMQDMDVFRHLELPMLRAVLPTAFLTIFLLCITSFAVALALGGGPRATTVELAIYQALRFEFDLSKAALFAIVQFALCTFAAFAALSLTSNTQFSFGLDRPSKRWDGIRKTPKALDTAALMIAGVFLLLPLSAIVLKGVLNLHKMPHSALLASLNSLAVALASAILCITLALTISATIIRLSPGNKGLAKLVESASFLTLAASPFVIGTGLFILIFPFADPFKLALPLTALINAVMTLPFALRVVLPAMQRAEIHYGRLADSLGMSPWIRFKLAVWPRIKRPTGFAMGLSAALSMGDLGVITLFAPPESATLPLTMYRLMAAYQMDAAGAVALLLISISLTLFWVFDRGGRIEHNIR